MKDDVATQILQSRRITEPINDRLATQKYTKKTTDMEEVAPIVVNEIMSDFLTMRYGVQVDKEHLVDRIFNVVPGKIVNADKADLDPEAPDVQRDIRRHSPNDIVDLLMMKKSSMRGSSRMPIGSAIPLSHGPEIAISSHVRRSHMSLILQVTTRFAQSRTTFRAVLKLRLMWQRTQTGSARSLLERPNSPVAVLSQAKIGCLLQR